jgi:hypothetical protein
MAAIVQVLESWLAFQKGKLNEAVRLLQEAESTLSATDDFVTRGNIQSAYGRIARRQDATKRPSNTSIAPSPNINGATPSTCTSLAPWLIL